MYPLVDIRKTMENHHFQWVNPLFQWPFSIANCQITRGYGVDSYRSTVMQSQPLKTRATIICTVNKKTPKFWGCLVFTHTRCQLTKALALVITPRLWFLPCKKPPVTSQFSGLFMWSIPYWDLIAQPPNRIISNGNMKPRSCLGLLGLGLRIVHKDQVPRKSGVTAEPAEVFEGQDLLAGRPWEALGCPGMVSDWLSLGMTMAGLNLTIGNSWFTQMVNY